MVPLINAEEVDPEVGVYLNRWVLAVFLGGCIMYVYMCGWPARSWGLTRTHAHALLHALSTSPFEHTYLVPMNRPINHHSPLTG